jgi:hypothetical protein
MKIKVIDSFPGYIFDLAKWDKLNVQRPNRAQLAFYRERNDVTLLVQKLGEMAVRVHIDGAVLGTILATDIPDPFLFKQPFDAKVARDMIDYFLEAKP